MSRAYHWLIEASKQEYEPASSELVNMVCNGEGAEEDIESAIHFLKGVSEQGGLDQECLNKLREKGIDIGAIGLVAAAMGVEQAYAQGSESTAEVAFHIEEPAIQKGEPVSGSNVDSQMDSATSEVSAGTMSSASEIDGELASQATFEVGEESVSQTAESASEAGAELVTEVGVSIVGEIAADLALDWIPLVGGNLVLKLLWGLIYLQEEI